MPQFDLISEKWIGVVRPNGVNEYVGLREALSKAQGIIAIRDALPTVEFGLYRLLIALFLDIYFIEGEMEADTRSLEDIISIGSFNNEEIDKYFTKYADLFDLFDTEHPFLQSPRMESDAKPLAGLLHPQPSGTNAAHFHHSHEDNFGLSPAAAARLLTTIAPFMTAGGAGLSPSINGAPPWYILVQGKNLFETLCLNTCLLASCAGKLGLPAWRDPRREIGGGRRPGTGYAEALTWRPRRIQLIPGASDVCSLTGQSTETIVNTMRFSAGDSCDFPYEDPNVAYRSGAKGWVAFRPQEGRQVWRDTGPLLLLDQRKGDEKRAERAQVIAQLDHLADEGAIDSLEVTLYGMRTDMKMKVFEWQRETLTLPIKVLLNTQIHHAAQKAIETADTIAKDMRFAIKRAYPRDGAGNKGAFKERIDQASRELWNSLRPDYDSLLKTLAPLNFETQDNDCRVALEKWESQIAKTAWSVLGDAIDDLDSNADALERWAKARASFARNLARTLRLDKEKASK